MQSYKASAAAYPKWTASHQVYHAKGMKIRKSSSEDPSKLKIYAGASHKCPAPTARCVLHREMGHWQGPLFLLCSI